MNRKAVSKGASAEIAGEDKSVQFSLRHSGEFGFKGILIAAENYSAAI